MKDYKKAKWDDAKKITSKTFVCWNCGKEIASEKGFNTLHQTDMGPRYSDVIYICYHCKAPNISDIYGNMVLNPLPGEEIGKLGYVYLVL